MAKSTAPCPTASWAGARSSMALPTALTSASTSLRLYSIAALSSSVLKSNITRIPGQTTGPQWVCDELSKSWDRSMPNFSCSRAASSSATSRGNPIRSVVMITARPPAPSSSTSALAQRSWITPSEGRVRAA